MSELSSAPPSAASAGTRSLVPSTAEPSGAQAVERMRLARARRDDMLGAVDVGLWYCDLPFDELAWDRKVKEHFWLDPDARVTIDTFYARLHPDDRERTRSSIEHSIAARGPYDIEYRTVAPADHPQAGVVRWVRAIGYTAYDDGGQPIRFDGVTVDVTATKATEARLAASEERFRTLVDATDQYIWTNDAMGRMTGDQPGWARLTGQSPAEYAGYGWTSALHPDDRERTVAAWDRAVAGRTRFEVEHRVRRSDGVWREFWVRAVPIADPDGVIREWVGVHTDVTERHEIMAARDRALAEARHERARLQEVFAQAPSAIGVTEGPEHRLVAANAQYDELTGHRPLIGRTVREAFPELEGQGFFELLDEVYTSGVPYLGREVPAHIDRDGDGTTEEYVFDFTYQPMRGIVGDVTGVLTHAVEVTHQVRARQGLEQKTTELAALAQALERSNRELDQFAYVASHDLKAPLRGIANLTQWIEEDLGDRVTGESREHMRLLKGRVHRLEGLIDGILAYSRAGRGRVAPEPVDLGALAREVVELVSASAGTRVEVAPDLPTIVAERVPLQQVLLNLIGNAVKFSAAHRPDALVRVGWRDAGDAVELTIADNGPGIAPEYHERIWEIFQTLQARDKVEGTGIGLSVVKKIVEARGGRVWLESAPLAGATFHVRLPRSARRAAAEGAA